jgi:hypothetical protein
VQLSGLAGVSAGAHLYAIRQAGATAGQILVSRSSLLSASAAAHLFDAGTDVTPTGGQILIHMRRRSRR